MSLIVSIECPSCATAFPVDPDKVPEGGARTECTVCASPFRVDPASWSDPGAEAPWAGSESADADDAFLGFSEVTEVAVVETTEEVFDEAVEADLGETFDAELEEAPEADHFETVEAEQEETVEAEHEEAPEADHFETVEAVHEETVEAEWEQAVETDEDETAAELPEFDEVGDLEISDDALDLAAFDAELDTSSGDEAGEPDSEAVPGPWSDIEDSGLEDAGAGPQTGEIVTDQWADLVDGDAEDGVEISADWGGDDGEGWVVETEDDSGLVIGEIEVERLDTVEEHVRAAQEDPKLTEPAEGVDTNGVLGSEDGGVGDFLTGGETMLPEDALESGGAGLDLEGAEGFEAGGELPGFGDDGEDESVAEDPAPVVEETPEPGPTFQFGRRDPHDKARRLARVLVSDMITYNPERHAEALSNGTVRADFEEEIEKSWAEYVEQVGPEIAESTDYWRDALNDVLAGGDTLF